MHLQLYILMQNFYFAHKTTLGNNCLIPWVSYSRYVTSDLMISQMLLASTNLFTKRISRLIKTFQSVPKMLHNNYG